MTPEMSIKRYLLVLKEKITQNYLVKLLSLLLSRHLNTLYIHQFYLRMGLKPEISDQHKIFLLRGCNRKIIYSITENVVGEQINT